MISDTFDLACCEGTRKQHRDRDRVLLRGLDFGDDVWQQQVYTPCANLSSVSSHETLQSLSQLSARVARLGVSVNASVPKAFALAHGLSSSVYADVVNICILASRLLSLSRSRSRSRSSTRSLSPSRSRLRSQSWTRLLSRSRSRSRSQSPGQGQGQGHGPSDCHGSLKGDKYADNF